MKKNIILVTGGSGFIGKELITALENLGFEVINYDIKFSKVFNILDPRILEDIFNHYRPIAVYHLAAISNAKDCAKNPLLAIRTNIEGSFNVLKIAKKYKSIVFLASSAATYEFEYNLYGFTKKTMENLAALFQNSVIVRFFNVYGKGSKSVVNKFIKAVKANKPIVLNGNTTRDYVYIDDVVNHLIDLIKEFDSNEIGQKLVEIGTGKGTTLKQLVRIIESLNGLSISYLVKEPLWEIQESIMLKDDNLVGKTSLKEGIKKLL